MPAATVIGSGVIGLSSALILQRAGYRVRILTRELPLQTTSVAAGAAWSGSELEGKSRSWAAITLQHFFELIAEPASGVSLQRMREVYAHPVPDPWYRDRLPFFERISAADLQPGLVDGYLMDVPMVAPPLYLAYLRDQFIAGDGTLEQRGVSSLAELQNETSLLVNCTGVGARELARDQRVYPMRGQTMLIDAPDITLGYMNHDRVDHIFPRSDGVLIGGIKRDDDWNRQVDADDSADILERTSKIEPGIAEARALRQFVGLRPGRDEVRLEAEQLSGSCRVIHNYGHGSVGYTLSWGCAEEVLALAQTTEE